MKTALRQGNWAGLLILVLLLTGCKASDARPQVHGKVIYKGEPVGNQTLTLISPGEDGEFSTQSLLLAEDGSFSGEVRSPGTYKLVIEQARAVQEGRQPAANTKAIPEKYRNRESSGLSWAVESGDNYKEFVLE